MRRTKFKPEKVKKGKYNQASGVSSSFLRTGFVPYYAKNGPMLRGEKTIGKHKAIDIDLKKCWETPLKVFDNGKLYDADASSVFGSVIKSLYFTNEKEEKEYLSADIPPTLKKVNVNLMLTESDIQFKTRNRKVEVFDEKRYACNATLANIAAMHGDLWIADIKSKEPKADQKELLAEVLKMLLSTKYIKISGEDDEALAKEIGLTFSKIPTLDDEDEDED